jgi:hypothetical protein
MEPRCIWNVLIAAKSCTGPSRIFFSNSFLIKSWTGFLVDSMYSPYSVYFIQHNQEETEDLSSPSLKPQHAANAGRHGLGPTTSASPYSAFAFLHLRLHPRPSGTNSFSLCFGTRSKPVQHSSPNVMSES